MISRSRGFGKMDFSRRKSSTHRVTQWGSVMGSRVFASHSTRILLDDCRARDLERETLRQARFRKLKKYRMIRESLARIAAKNSTPLPTAETVELREDHEVGLLGMAGL